MLNELGHLDVPSKADRESADESSKRLSRLGRSGKALRVRPVGARGRRSVLVLPRPAVRLLVDGLTHIAKGDAVAVLPVNAELTTQQAAELLNVSRPFVIKLLDTGKIRFRKVGTHRRVRFRDVLAFQRRSQSRQRAALKSLVAEGQELDLGY